MGEWYINYYTVLEYCDFLKLSFIPFKYLGPKWPMVNICLIKYISELHLELEIEFHYEKPTFRPFFHVLS